MSKDLGKSTSYAYYVAEGGTKTPQEYGEMLVNIDTVATRAEEAADSAAESATGALNSKNAAQTAATTATNKASEATTAATTATTKAGEASTSASTATSAKDTAVSAASTATTKATEATTAAATATSAKTDAVAANTAAQSAKTAAQTAQTGAETAAASVQSSAAQIATNAADISQLKSEITDKSDTADMLKAFPTDTASGSVASFADGANVPVKSLIVNIDPVQSGSGDPSPENLCPISGWTQVNVEQRGVNVWDEEWEVGDISASTGENADFNSIIRTKNYIPVKPNTQYFVYINDSGSGPLRSRFYDINKDFIGTAPKDKAAVAYNQPFTTPDNCYYMRFTPQASYGTTYNHDISINYPSTDHDYHPYSGQSITIPLGQTVYGGKLDVTNGVLTVDRTYIKYDGSADETWYTYASSGYRVPMSGMAPSGSGICNLAPTVLTASSYGVMFSASANYIYFFQTVNKWGVATIADLREWLATNNVEVCFQLATPLTITLDPISVSALLGSNNVWADSGDSEVIYRADPTLYIQRLTEPDADMVADSNITSGSYFMVGNTLYKATANIANGSAIIVGTNAVRKSLSEALNEINA